MTRNGRVRPWVVPSIDTWRSAMASSIAAWVFGGARLISSPRTRLAKIGPGRNSNSRRDGSQIDEPVTSAGIRSGVNWMRCIDIDVTWASERASSVFARPGTSSISTWPSASYPASTSSITERLPTTTCSTSATMASTSGPTSRGWVTGRERGDSVVMGSFDLGGEVLHGGEHVCGRDGSELVELRRRSGDGEGLETADEALAPTRSTGGTGDEEGLPLADGVDRGAVVSGPAA